MHEATLKLRESKLGPDHPDTLTSRNNLAKAYQAAGRIAEAIRTHEQTLEAAGGEARARPSRYAHQPMHNLAVAYQAAGRTAEAIKLLEATLKLRESKLGPDHPDTLTSRNNLALAYELPPAARAEAEPLLRGTPGTAAVRSRSPTAHSWPATWPRSAVTS